MYDPTAPGFYQDPYPQFEQLRAVAPVFWSESQDVWIVTGQAEAISILRDRRFSSHSFPFKSPTGEPLGPEMIAAIESIMVGVPVFADPPDHTRLRAIVRQAFAPKAIEAMRPMMAVTADQLLDAVVDAGRMDVVADYAEPLPLIVLVELLGVPAADRPLFEKWLEALTHVADIDPSPELMMGAFTGLIEMRQYIGELVRQRKTKPRDDLLGTLIAAEEEGERLTEEELVGFGANLLVAGHESTAGLIGTSVYLLLTNPEQLARLQADPELIPNAVEELLRYEAPVQVTVAPRVALADITVGGQTIRQGQSVRILLGAANRDPAQYAEPNRLDVTRSASHHLAFATGAHVCLGAQLARVEGQVALERLLDRIDNLSLDTDEVGWMESSVARKLEALPITFSARKGSR